MIVRDNETFSGRAFVHTYSDAGVKIERDGVMYDDAYDPAELASERVYTETKVPVTPVPVVSDGK